MVKNCGKKETYEWITNYNKKKNQKKEDPDSQL